MHRQGRQNWIILVSFFLLLAGCKQSPLYSQLTEQQANEIEAALLTEKLDASKVRAENGEDWAITLPKEQIPRAMSILKSQGLPRYSSLSMGDIFRKEGFVSSPMEERARYLYALSQELSATLMQIDGVASARVHVALPEQGLLEEKSQSASVAVVIIQQPGANLRRYETDFKAIIMDGVEGVSDVNRVTVKFFSRGAASANANVKSAASDTPHVIEPKLIAPDSQQPIEVMPATPLEAESISLEISHG